MTGRDWVKSGGNGENRTDGGVDFCADIHCDCGKFAQGVGDSGGEV